MDCLCLDRPSNYYFFVLLKIVAPYGRHIRPGWGLTLNHRLAWLGTELVSPLTFSYFLFSGDPERWTAPVFIFAILWLIHYFNRSIVHAIRMKSKSKQMPLLILVFAIFFNSVNGFLNGYYLGHLAHYPAHWIYDARFLAGPLFFIGGMMMNMHADEILFRLRKAEESTYQIPRGGMYTYISCPNYLGEIIECLGFALMTWSLPGLSFAVWTIANLAPRALANHRWYLQAFPEYPQQRRALLPFFI